MKKNIVTVVAALMLATLFNPANVLAKGDVLMPGMQSKVVKFAVSTPMQKVGKLVEQVPKVKAKKIASKKSVATPMQKVVEAAPKKGPHALILKRDYSAAELDVFLKVKQLRSAHIDACWRGDTTGIFDGMIANGREHILAAGYTRYGIDVRGHHAPVIWSDFSYRPEVVHARTRDRYTGAYMDYKLACQSAGHVSRWNPYECKRDDDDGVPARRQIWWEESLKGDPYSDCYAPEEKFPTFRAGHAIWVTDE